MKIFIQEVPMYLYFIKQSTDLTNTYHQVQPRALAYVSTYLPTTWMLTPTRLGTVSEITHSAPQYQQ